MKLFYIILFFLVFLFIKFPIKIRVLFANNEFKLYLYKILLFSNVSKSFISKRTEKKIKKNAKKTIKKRKLVVKNLIEKLAKIKYKINIKIDLKCDMGIGDAAYTAILYGISNILTSFIYIFTSKLFKIKKYNIDFIPNFNKTTLIIDLKCIINVNIVNIITVLFVTLSSFEKVKEIKNNENFKEANYGR